MPQPATKDASPPYLSFSTVKNFMDSFKESGVPDRIDRTLLPGQSGTTQTYLLAALRFFGFIDQAGAPTELMEEWHRMSDDEKPIYEKAIKQSYAFLFDGSIKLEAATEGQLREKMKEKDIQGDTARKAITFFVNACDFAGIPISPHLKGKRSSSSSRVGGPRRAVKKKKATNVQADPTPHHEHQSRSKGHSLQEMLLEKFPPFDPEWSEELKKKWFEGFEKFMASANPQEPK